VTVGVLALQGDVREHAAAFADLGEEARPVRTPADLAGLSGIVLPGGESTTLSLLLRSSGLAEALGDALNGGLPAFGTCAGMILLADRVLDGRSDQYQFRAIDMAVRRNAYGTQAASFEADLEVATLGPVPLHVVFIRAPAVESVGDDVEVLAWLPEPARAWRRGPASGHTGLASDAAPGAAPVVCRQGSVLVSAFHPELSPDRRLHGLFLEMIEAGGRDGDRRDANRAVTG
jgi:5'-phosphate synthase pdxT subunit